MSTPRPETPDTVYGRLLESAHLSGYTLERAVSEFEWLLDDGRWQTVGPGFDDPAAFVASIDFSEFRFSLDRRKALARKLAALSVPQRTTAKMLGVGKTTIVRDLDDSSGPSGPRDAADPPNGADEPRRTGPNGPPPFAASGEAAAKLVRGRAKRKERDHEAEERRVEEARASSVAGAVEPTIDIRHGDFRTVLADLRNVDAIITDPPYAREHLPLLADLAAWADRVLAPDGVLAVLFGQSHLPDVYRLLGGHRPYRWTACLLTEGAGYASHAGRVQCNWKPVLVYGGGPRFADLIRTEGADVAAKSHHKWGQDFAAFRTLVERLTQPGQTVADPFCGSGTTLLAARTLGRHTVGCDVDAAAVSTATTRVA